MYVQCVYGGLIGSLLSSPYPLLSILFPFLFPPPLPPPSPPFPFSPHPFPLSPPPPLTYFSLLLCVVSQSPVETHSVSPCSTS